MRAKKSLGQNFLTSRGVTRDIVAAANITPNDVVLEIGPGKGFLTEGLLQKSGKVIAVEKDDRMVLYLKDKFAQEIRSEKLKLVHGDILTLNLTDYKLKTNDYKLVANIPYYITGEILRTFLSGDLQPQRMVLMVQKEVADRIVARPSSRRAGTGKESILSMSVKAYGTPRYIQKIPRRNFLYIAWCAVCFHAHRKNTFFARPRPPTGGTCHNPVSDFFLHHQDHSLRL